MFSMWKIKFINFRINKKKLKLTTSNILVTKWSKIANLFFEQIADSTNTKSTSSRSFDWWICLNIAATDANMQPPVGPFLGQHGFNTNLFCKGFNDLTSIFPKFLPLRVLIKLFNDKSLLFWIKLPSTAYLIYTIIKSKNENFLTPLDILKISFLKKIDYPNFKMISLTSMILGTAKSMKISIKNNETKL